MHKSKNQADDVRPGNSEEAQNLCTSKFPREQLAYRPNNAGFLLPAHSNQASR